MNIYGMNFLIVEGNAVNCSFMRMHGISDRYFKSKSKAGKVAQCLRIWVWSPEPIFKKKPVMSLPVKVDLGGWLASQTSVLQRSRPAGDNVWNRQAKGFWRGKTSEAVLWHKHQKLSSDLCTGTNTHRLGGHPGEPKRGTGSRFLSCLSKCP